MAAENVSRIEPCRLERIGARTADLLVEVQRLAARLGNRLHPRTAATLADLVRVMNCYYSNLIEGHDTRPRDIERALASDFAEDVSRRNLQLEAAAHIRVQQEIDRRFSSGTLSEPGAVDTIRWLHREFYAGAPDALLRVGEGPAAFVMKPGEFRSSEAHEVAVGRHQPPSSARVADFMAYFEERFRYSGMSPSERILCVAIAHHRFNFIHPFPDGNGRVSRLMSHAMAHFAGIGAHGLWSISRGLARGLESRGDYKRMMDLADSPREGDLDGRGNLSLRALEAFTEWFLSVCVDQLRFLGDLFDLVGLGDRLKRFVRDEGLGEGSERVLVELVARGELRRGEVAPVAGVSDRTAQRILSRLTEVGIVGSDSPKAPISLRFPVSLADRLFPRLFPEI